MTERDDESTQRLSSTETHEHWYQVLEQVVSNRARLVVEDHGVPVAAIVSAEDYERFTCYEREREERFKVIDEVRAAFKDVPDDELESEVASAIASVRRRRREAAERGASTA